MFSRGMADSSRYTLYRRSVWPNAKTMNLHKYFACRFSPKYNNLVWHAVRGTAHLWPWSWHTYGPIRIKFWTGQRGFIKFWTGQRGFIKFWTCQQGFIKFWTGQRGFIKAPSTKFQQNVMKRQKMAFNEVGSVIISITKNSNGRLALCKGLSYRVTQNIY